MLNSQTFTTVDGVTVTVDKHEEFTEEGHVIQGLRDHHRAGAGLARH